MLSRRLPEALSKHAPSPMVARVAKGKRSGSNSAVGKPGAKT